MPVAFWVRFLYFVKCPGPEERALNFPTLYACESLWEDFAESFATYFHVVIDQRPWQIIIVEAGRPDRVIRSCWGTARCREKERFMRNWFENPGGEQRLKHKP